MPIPKLRASTNLRYNLKMILSLVRRTVFFIIAAAAALSAQAQAQEAAISSFVVQDIRVEGIRRFDPGVVF